MNKVEQMINLALEFNVNHVGIYRGDMVPMNNTCGAVHNVDDLKRIAALEHSVRELCGVISEYQVLPDKSLLKAMVATKDRHSVRVNNDEPPQRIGAE